MKLGPIFNLQKIATQSVFATGANGLAAIFARHAAPPGASVISNPPGRPRPKTPNRTKIGETLDVLSQVASGPMLSAGLMGTQNAMVTGLLGQNQSDRTDSARLPPIVKMLTLIKNF